MEFNVRSKLGWFVIWLAGVAGGWPLLAQGQTTEFTLDGVRIELREVTSDVAVSFRSMRLNRPLNQWNVEVNVSNRTAQAIAGPLVLLVESYQGTTGPVRPDGTLGGGTPKAYYDLTGWTSGVGLAGGQSTSLRTLSLGFAAGTPALVTRVFAGVASQVAPLGVTRSLNEVGQPLPGAQLSIRLAEGGPVTTQTTDVPSGVASFGSASGDYELRFSQAGALDVWRRQTLATGAVAVVINPRLASRNPRLFEITPLGGWL